MNDHSTRAAIYRLYRYRTRTLPACTHPERILHYCALPLPSHLIINDHLIWDIDANGDADACTKRRRELSERAKAAIDRCFGALRGTRAARRKAARRKTVQEKTVQEKTTQKTAPRRTTQERLRDRKICERSQFGRRGAVAGFL